MSACVIRTKPSLQSSPDVQLLESNAYFNVNAFDNQHSVAVVYRKVNTCSIEPTVVCLAKCMQACEWWRRKASIGLPSIAKACKICIMYIIEYLYCFLYHTMYILSGYIHTRYPSSVHAVSSQCTRVNAEMIRCVPNILESNEFSCYAMKDQVSSLTVGSLNLFFSHH